MNSCEKLTAMAGNAPEPQRQKIIRLLKLVRGELLAAADTLQKAKLVDAEAFFAAEAARFTTLIETCKAEQTPAVTL